MTSNRNWIMSGAFAAGATLGTALLWTMHVHAEGIPSATALTYSGTLEDVSGAPVTGTKEITVALFDAIAGATQVCSTTQVTELNRGRFAVPLEEPCRAAVAAKPDLWVEVVVKDSGSLGRTKLGAVPYAVEAAHAASATKAAGAVNDFSVPGSLTVSGKASVGVHVVSSAPACVYNGTSFTDCKCPEGEYAISGGGAAAESFKTKWLVESAPVRPDAWRVSCSDQTGTRSQCATTFAVCARLQ